MKDLVNAPTQKYDNMYNIIGNSQSTSLSSLPSLASLTSTSSHDASSFLPSSASASASSSSYSASTGGDPSSFLMKNELKHFLKTQLKR